MKLTIISPESEETLDVAWVEVNTHAGNFIVLQDHAPLVATLKLNETVTICLENGKQENIQPEGGIIEVHRKQVKLLLTKAP